MPVKAQLEPMSVVFLMAIIEHVAHPIFVKDREYRFVLVNAALCRMVGYTRAEMLGKTDYEFFPAQQADYFRKKDIEMFSTAATVEVEEEPITDADGAIHILSTTKAPYRDQNGQVTHLVGIISDISEIKRAEDTLKTANVELERRIGEHIADLASAQDELLRKERLSVLGQLAGGLAHQLRNPLGAIQNAVSLINKEDLTTDQLQALDIIVEEVWRADRTITNLLDYARVRPAQLRAVDVVQLLEGALELEHVPVDIEILFGGDEESLAMVDVSQVQLAVGNVIRNAIEAMDGAGQLSLHVQGDDDTVRVSIRDSGPGVTEEAGLFEPLVTTKSLGSGLGLSTARNLIQNQGGSIRYVPHDGPGARFVITLPRAGRER
jgi:PAS domain S-box-containing protein